MTETLTNQTTTETPITVTEKALSEIRKIKDQNDIPAEYGLRVGVKGGGCSGLTYSLAFDAETRDNDHIMEFEGQKLYVDKKSLFYLMGCEIDFTDGLNGRGFSFNNPQATRTCGCGESFGV